MIEPTYNPFLGDAFERAFLYATRHHAGQPRKGTTVPYISHLMQVAGLVLEAGGGEDATVAALLHDAIEDDLRQPPGARTEILEQFGERVLKIVEALTDADVHPKPPWEARKRSYLQHLESETDPDVLLVSCADKLHNARAIVRDVRAEGAEVWKRFKGGRDGSIWYYRSLLEIYQARDLGPLVNEFAEAVRKMEALAR